MTPAWLTEARRYLGTREIPGAENSPVIMSWAAYLGGWFKSFYTDDSKIAWCGLFMGYLMKRCGFPPPSTLLSAAGWASWGSPLTKPSLGAVMVFTRPGGAHVALYVGERKDAYRVIGGNQGDAVSEMWIAKSRLSAIRWPKDAPEPAGGPVLLANDGKPVSVNEA